MNDLSCISLLKEHSRWWDVISDADVFHTRSMSFYAFIVCVCVCVFFARLVH